MDKKPDEEKIEGASLEGPNAGADTGTDSTVISAESDHPQPTGPPPELPFSKKIVNRLLSFNIYLLLFVFVLVVAGVIVLFSYNYSKKKSNTTTTVNTTTLSQDMLDQLANSDTTVGTNSQVLNVQSSAVFAGKVLVRSDLQVAGNLQIGGTLNISSIAVNDTAQLGQTTISKNLAVSGDSAVQGQETVGKSLQVGGGGTFSGSLSSPQISTNSLLLNGDLTLTHHFTAGGGTPSRSNGDGLGSGGTASVSGSDTAGSVTINTGSSPSAGCFLTITFTSKYAQAPHVLVTPVGSAAGGLGYYVTRTTSSFSICAATAAPANTNFGFDYFVVG